MDQPVTSYNHIVPSKGSDYKKLIKKAVSIDLKKEFDKMSNRLSYSAVIFLNRIKFEKRLYNESTIVNQLVNKCCINK